MYDGELIAVLDQLILLRAATRRPRPSVPWFDAECRAAKRQTRRLERAYAAELASSPQSRDITRLVVVTIRQKRPNRSCYPMSGVVRPTTRLQTTTVLLHHKCTSFCSEKIETDRFRTIIRSPRRDMHIF